MKLKLLLFLLETLLMSFKPNPSNYRCLAYTNAGNQCKNSVWSGCSYGYCYNHCR